MIVIRSKFVLLVILIATIIPLVFFAVSKKIQNADSTPVEEIQKANFKSKSVPAGSESAYEMNLTLNKEGMFHLDSSVTIKNTSGDSWENLVFYFIPNMFTKDIAPHLDHPAIIQFNEVTVNGETSSFELNKDTLNIPLREKLLKNQDVTIKFDYHFTLPEKGLRFNQNNGNYYLAQFYPMVATYRNHKWNKKDHRFKGETYHTGFSDFKVNYDIPKGYTMASTSESDQYPSENQGTLEVRNTKEIFIALLKTKSIAETDQGDVNIRVLGLDENHALYEDISKEAAAALHYFQENIGPYPYKQLDIIIDQLGMEYPGVVTSHSLYDTPVQDDEALKRMVIHEIAHQWFYGVISNDSYHEAWLDEGLADFATTLYLYSKEGKDIPYKAMYQQVKNLEPLPVNLPLDQYEANSSSYIYGKSHAMLWKLFEKRGGKKEAEKFLKSYYRMYNYKEVNTQEFVRFTQHYFNLKDQNTFKEWLKL